MSDAVVDPAAVSPDADDPTELRSWGWHLLQLSSWILVVMVPVHLVSIWIVDDSSRFGVGTFVNRWHLGFWRFFDWTFIVLALLHGGIGLNTMVGSRLNTDRSRATAAWVIGIALSAVGLAASVAILRFEV